MSTSFVRSPVVSGLPGSRGVAAALGNAVLQVLDLVVATQPHWNYLRGSSYLGFIGLRVIALS